MANPYLCPRPAKADPVDIDGEGFRVIRGSDGRPLAYIEKDMWQEDQETLARLFIRAADMLDILKELHRASAPKQKPVLTANEWVAIRDRSGNILDELGKQQMRQTADQRGIDRPTMRGREMRRVRLKCGLGLYELASLLRYRDIDGLRKMEENDGLLSGPLQFCMEALDNGLVNPDAELR